MKNALSFIFLCLLFSNVSAQQLALETSLDAIVNETSGLLFLNNTLITHNDSATTNQLFDVDISTGLVTRTVTITNATNVDWEDLTHDDTYIYIGDFGNYQGDRTDLKIYRISIADYFNNTLVTADIINFSYSNQTDFSPSPLATNFDAEGLIHFNDMLYVFSKNWLDGKTNIYQLPKIPGTYNISMVDTIESQGLVSGATYNTLDGSIIICGYGVNGPYLIHLTAFHSGLFSNGNTIKTSVSVPSNYSTQIEAIIPINATEYYVSAEENSTDASGLYSFNISTLRVETFYNHNVSFYPNPAKDEIILSRENCKTKIYAITGKLVKTSDDKRIDISHLKSGFYLVKIEDNSIGNTFTKRLIVDK